jgi:hypothetical protein
MTRYSITRKRNIKKYKKSRTGRGKGRRSIRRCKTRKPKGFKKAKRYTVGKRRRMVGGYEFDVTMEQLKQHITKQCRKSLPSLGIHPGSQLELVLMGYGDVCILKDAFFADNFRPEQVVAVRCDIKTGDTTSEGQYYAIVRCANTDSCPGGNGIWSTVLFVKRGGVKKMDYKEEQSNRNPVIKKREDDTFYALQTDIDKFFNNYVWFEFTNSISSTDKYNIFVDNRNFNMSRSLQAFFSRLSGTDLQGYNYNEIVTFEIMKAAIVALKAKRDAEAQAQAEKEAAEDAAYAKEVAAAKASGKPPPPKREEGVGMGWGAAFLAGP